MKKMVGRWYIEWDEEFTKMMGELGAKRTEVRVYDTGGDEYEIYDTKDGVEIPYAGKANKDNGFFRTMKETLERCKQEGWVKDYMMLVFDEDLR